MKKLVFWGDYTSEENVPIFKAFDSFDPKGTCFNYLYLTRTANLPTNKRVEFINENEIDIFRSGQELMVDLGEDDFLDLSDIIDEESINKFQLTFCKRGDKFISLPDSIDGLVLFYNKKFLEGIEVSEYTITWDDFVKILRKVKEQNPNIIPFAIHNLRELKGWWAYYLFSPFFAQAGLDFHTLDVNRIFEYAPVQETFEFFEQLIKEGLIGILDQDEYEGRSIIAFARSEVAFMLEGPWSISAIKRINPDLLDSVDVAILENKQKATIVGGRYFSILSGSKQKDFAKDFLESLIKGSYYLDILKIGKLPGYMKEENSPSGMTQKIYKLFNDYGQLEVTHKNETEIQEDLGDKIGKKILGMLD